MAKRLVFGDMGPKYSTYPVTGPDNVEYEVRIKIMTEQEVNAVNAGVDEPKPPMVMVPKGGNPKNGYEEKANLEDPEYVKKSREANRQRMYRLLASAVDLDVPGDTIEAKSQALQTNGVPAWLLAKCVDIINQSLGLNTAEVMARAESFQSG